MFYMPPSSLAAKHKLEVSVCSDGGYLGRNLVLGRCLVTLDGLNAQMQKVSPLIQPRIRLDLDLRRPRGKSLARLP